MKTTKIIAILNATPDSFYDGGWGELMERGLKMAQEGADLIDIGGQSTRPGSSPISIDEELDRVCPLIEELRKRTATPLSIDTDKPAVARAALDLGVSMLNDVTGFTNPEMRKVAVFSSVPIVVMHMQKNPQQMQLAPSYPKGVVCEVAAWFKVQAALLIEEGVLKERIILDPGIGFGKTVDHNLQLLGNIQTFLEMGFPLLIGLSRKSFMQKILNKSVTEVLSTTLALNTMAMLGGVDYVRVHDVREHREILTVLERLQTVNS
ncbi:MAG: dihydropteroate synthase [Chlamydiales bacterium]